MKKWLVIAIIVLALILMGIFIRFIIGGNEDDWIKDERGMWVKHGVPASVPAEVKVQQEAVICAQNLYQQKKLEMNFSSQCLGSCGDYAVDIVHVPRDAEDNKIENQCSDFRGGKVSSFIELDKNGEIIRIV